MTTSEPGPGSAAAAAGCHYLSQKRKSLVAQYVERVASLDLEEYKEKEWDLTAPLPKLPVPALGATLEKYLETVEPVVSAEELERTRRLVEEFGAPGGEGEKLQAALEEYAEGVDCWANEFWMEDMYMRNQLALPINSNPGMAFPRQHFEDDSARLRFTARLISGIMDYKTILDARALPIDRCRHREKGQPMCMEQYYRLFPSYRRPGLHRDCLVQPAAAAQDSLQQDSLQQDGLQQDGLQHPDSQKDHIIVCCRDQLFVLDLMNGSTRLSDDNIYCQLKRILCVAEDGAAADPPLPRVGILTAAARDRWARNRHALRLDRENCASLELIETCLFVLCLDKPTPLSFNHQRSVTTDENERDDVSLAMQMLHGSGSRLNSANRWFDKTMQFVIGGDGACGLCYEHSASEGIAVVQLIEHLLQYMEEIRKRKLPRMQSICDLPDPRKLTWNVSPEIEAEIDEVAAEHDRAIATLDLYVLRFMDFGKNFPKAHNMSPDAFIQLALQLTYFKLHGHLVPTYESASIRRFRYGRVDNIRACTRETLAWCRAMAGGGDKQPPTVQEKKRLLQAAMAKQTQLLVDAILGHGIDNHLLGLRQMAAGGTPALFTDDVYTRSNRFQLSTSQVPTTMDCFMCYGPVVPDGYGACYNPHEDYMVVIITSFNHCDTTDSDVFALALADSFREMRDMCEDAAAGQHKLNNNHGH